MKYIAFLAILMLVLSCSKEDNNTRPAHMTGPFQAALMAHVWIQDSLSSPGSQTIINHYPKYTRTFGELQYYFGVETVSDPIDTLRYNMIEPNTVYFWREGEPRDSTDYFKIDTITDTTLVLSFPGTYTIYEWLHAKL